MDKFANKYHDKVADFALEHTANLRGHGQKDRGQRQGQEYQQERRDSQNDMNAVDRRQEREYRDERRYYMDGEERHGGQGAMIGRRGSEVAVCCIWERW